MHIRHLLVGLGALFFATLGLAPAQAAPPANISYTVGVCDPWYPSTRCLKPAADGSLAVTGSFTPSGTADSNLKQVNGATVNVGAGAAGTGTQRVTTSTDSTIGTVTSVTAIANALPAGSAIIGKFGIDQSTPGTTNGVQVNAALPAGSNVIGHVIADTGSTTAATQATAANLNATVVGTGTFAVQADITKVNGTTALTGGVAGSLGVGGLAANNATASGNPIQQSCIAISAEATVATAAQNASCVADLAHKQIVLPYANPENFVSGTTAAMTGTTSTSLIAAPASGLRNYITNITCVNSHATVGTFVTVQDGSGGTALYTLAAAAVFGGATVSFPAPLRQPTTATALFVADVTTGANVICSASGYKGS